MIRVTCFLKNKKSRKKLHFRITDFTISWGKYYSCMPLSFYLEIDWLLVLSMVKITTVTGMVGSTFFFYAPWVIHGTSPGFGLLVVAPPIQVD